METTKNDFSPYEKAFFNKMTNYIGEPLYFFGSIQRSDYFPGLSDIDIDIFTFDEKTTLIKLEKFLDMEPSDFKKFVYKIDKKNNKGNEIVVGYKTKYIDTGNSLTVEISVFNEKYKETILTEHRSKFNLPFYITWFLMFLKVLHYNLSILPIYYYSLIKKTITNKFYDGNKSEFVVVELTDK
jgi:predicted nucleotidyltransferase